jgi:hypothetical protein
MALRAARIRADQVARISTSAETMAAITGKPKPVEVKISERKPNEPVYEIMGVKPKRKWYEKKQINDFRPKVQKQV